MIRNTSLGQVSSRIDYGISTSAVERPDGPRLLRITDIEDAAVDWEKVPGCRISHEDAAKYELLEGDIVVARTGASTGRAAWVCPPIPAIFASYLVRFRVRTEMSSRYISYVLRSSAWRQFIYGSAHSKSAQPNLSASRMAEFVFPCPDLAEQIAVSQVLGALDDKIAANAELAHTADDLARALTRKAATDTPLVPLGEVASITMGSSPPGESYNELRTGLPFYQGVRDFGLRSPKNRVWTTAPGRLADVDDTLVSVRAPVGRVNVAREISCVGRGLASVRSLLLTPNTLPYLLQYDAAVWAAYEASGTVFGSINKRQLESIKIAAPGGGDLQRLDESITLLAALIESLLSESDTLAELRDTLLPHLMSGRLKVRDAEKTVSDAV